jgi:hypothetical protein
MAAAFPSGTNTFIPSFEASGMLQVAYSRNPKSFRLNQWCQIVPVKKGQGYYLAITAEEADRIINTNNSDFVWGDGESAPDGNDNLESFQFLPFFTQRYAFPFTIGDKAVDQADFKLLAAHAGIAAQKAMTARAVRAITVATTTGNYDTGHTATATALAGGLVDAGTPTTPYLKKALAAMAIKINQDTIGVVSPDQLIVVFNPNTADKIARSQEIHIFLQGSYWVREEIEKGIGPNAQFGLPSQIYGYKVVVEDTVKNTAKKGVAKANAYAFPDQQIIMVSRVGGLEGTYGSPSFSTITQFTYEDMTVESMDDRNNRRTMGRVVDDTDVRVTASAAGYVLTAATS